jgi:SlyX protein
MSDELYERMTELEIRFSHQGQLVDELNEVVSDCNLRISRLEREIRQLQEMLKSLSPEMLESPDE